MTNKVEMIKRRFQAKNLQVSDYFLECCIEWVQSQFNGLSDNELYEKVYEQWLLVDLKEIGARCLPIELSKQKKTILQGNFAVQVMYFKDISKSSLSQLKKIRNMYKLTRANVDKDSDQEPQGKRVLYLHLTDGVESIFAFEYETVKCLDINLPPGIKLMLVGPLMIRNGEILLKNMNVKILGGEIEDLLVCNAVENVLARELNLPENPNPGVVETQMNENNDTNYNNDVQVEPRNQVNTHSVNQTTHNTHVNVNKTVTHNQQLSNKNYTNNNSNNSSNKRNQIPVYNPKPSTSRCELPEEQQIVISDDDEMFMDILDEYEEKQKKTTVEYDEELDFNDEFMDFDVNDHLEEAKHEKVDRENLILPLTVSREPYNYIKQILDNKYKLLNKTVKVKAQFVNVVEKLTFSKTKGWNMKFKITDGTGVIVVDFLKEVLEELTGVSHDEALVLKEKIKNKVVSAAERITEVLYECKDKLTLLNCFMGLKFIGQTEIPTVIWIKPVLLKDLKNLKLRVDRVKELTET